MDLPAVLARQLRMTKSLLGLLSALALLVAVGAAGCGADSTSTTRTPTGGPTSVTPAPSPSLPTSAQMAAALLTASDLGPAFTPPTDADGSDDSTVTGCESPTNLLDAPPNAHRTRVQADFTAGALGPVVAESLTTGNQTALARDYNRVRTALAQCCSLTFASSETALTFALSPINFGGPGATAVRMDSTYQGVEVNGYLAVDRIGPVVFAYVYFHVGSGSSQLASHFYTKAVAKVQRVLGTELNADRQ